MFPIADKVNPRITLSQISFSQIYPYQLRLPFLTSVIGQERSQRFRDSLAYSRSWILLATTRPAEALWLVTPTTEKV